ncbi:sugar phosphate isomerase/epimerase [Flagellimonas sp. CMM7]|uniref:sugar phosphate isomerase/epimerase family protein n=1 Tax=Flagellimonas sp. CMM7 TaxID=2654676 RepID=UPI0013D17425|nr:sugar phosphate isomerase/epimerase family protein [Flagellimonas sp. CMM7]UII80392.1 sugar phosphate isomerase/epimerase [Flagellimonas sp. CMM7]
MKTDGIPNMDRRKFMQTTAILSVPLLFGCNLPTSKKQRLALSQWALHRAIFGNSKEDYAQWEKWLTTDPDQVLKGTLDPLDFPSIAKNTYGFDAVEYVNTFFYRKDEAYFKELKNRSDDVGVTNLLIMVDQEGMLGDPDPKKRKESVQRHKRWLSNAAILGCHSIRVNAHSSGTKEEQQSYVIESLTKLCNLAKPLNLDILIENHGGMSSEPNWLLDTIKKTNKPNLGTMVDFDNFKYSETKIWNGELTYDRYEGVALLLPYAKSVSAKSYAFDDSGLEKTIDFKRMVQLIKDSGFKNYISVEYEGEGEDSLSEKDGILATKKLLEQYI